MTLLADLIMLRHHTERQIHYLKSLTEFIDTVSPGSDMAQHVLIIQNALGQLDTMIETLEANKDV